MLTPDEYAAIGRRVAAMRHHALGNGGCLSDRAALWELCERLMADKCLHWKFPDGHEAWLLLDGSGTVVKSRKAAVAALLESQPDLLSVG